MSLPSRAAALAALAVAFAPAPAGAFVQFQRQFLDVYIKEHQDPEYVKFVKMKAKCWVCHQGRVKKNCNPYGARFVPLLSDEDKKDPKRIAAALKKVGAMRSDPKDNESPTYDELIASSKLPGGKLEEVKKEPPKDGAAPTP